MQLRRILIIFWVVLIFMSSTALNQFEKETVVAIIDTGFNGDIVKKHKTWENKSELPNNHIDDDNNGYIDDCYG